MDWIQGIDYTIKYTNSKNNKYDKYDKYVDILSDKKLSSNIIKIINDSHSLCLLNFNHNLKFNNNNNNQIEYSKLKKLYINDSKFNKQLTYLPPSLDTLYFSIFSIYNYPINYPYTLINLQLGNNYTCTIDNLPQSLKTLYIGHKFNNSINYLPISLITITLGYMFNKSLDYLPNMLSEISLSRNFNYRLDKLPVNITYISIWGAFDYTLDNIPFTLQILFICAIFKNKNLLNLGNNIMKLTIDQQNKYNYNSYDFTGKIKYYPKIEILKIFKKYKYIDELYKIYRYKLVIM